MFNEDLATRVRLVLATVDFTERKMFGGLAYLVNGHMACGIVGDELMVRTGPEKYAEVLARPNARAMDFTGRPMKGMVFVDPAGLGDRDLRKWVEIGVSYVAGLPPKVKQ